ncbi:MAG: tetratricopeptide repeat protein [Chloroflexota bacterium]
MIELLLQAERALAMGLVDQAERLYAQAVAADPRNSIAVVGLARVALERTDDDEAYRLARQALEIDPENAAAVRLVGRLEEVYAARGLPVPGTTGDRPQPTVAGGTPSLAEPAVAPPGPAPSPAAPPGPAPAIASPQPAPSAVEPAAPPVPVASPAPGPSPARRSLFDRLLRRNRP